jgi:hypothetical protein
VCTGAGFEPLVALAVNPGMDHFSWLHPIANQFDFYRFTNLSFEFVPLLPATTAGNVRMFFDPDTLDEAPTSAIEFAAHGNSISGPIWSPLKLDVPRSAMDRFTDWHFVRGGSVTSDSKTYDVGRIHFAVNASAAATVGELHVHYVVEFCQPSLMRPEHSGTTIIDLDTSGGLPFAGQIGEVVGNFVVTGAETLKSLATKELLPITSMTSAGNFTAASLLREVGGSGNWLDTYTPNGETHRVAYHSVSSAVPALFEKGKEYLFQTGNANPLLTGVLEFLAL